MRERANVETGRGRVTRKTKKKKPTSIGKQTVRGRIVFRRRDVVAAEGKARADAVPGAKASRVRYNINRVAATRAEIGGVINTTRCFITRTRVLMRVHARSVR